MWRTERRKTSPARSGTLQKPEPTVRREEIGIVDSSIRPLHNEKHEFEVSNWRCYLANLPNNSMESSDAAIYRCVDDNRNHPMPKLIASAMKDTW